MYYILDNLTYTFLDINQIQVQYEIFQLKTSTILLWLKIMLTEGLLCHELSQQGAGTHIFSTTTYTIVHTLLNPQSLLAALMTPVSLPGVWHQCRSCYRIQITTYKV